MLAILIATYSLAEKGNHFASGVALGLGLIKFHLFLLWPLGLIVQKRWRMLLGASIAAAAELLVSLWLSGPRGLLTYAELLRNKSIERLSPSPELMINVDSLVLNFAHGNGIVHILLIGFVVLLVAAACWRAPLWRAIAATSAGSLLVPPHVYGYDAALLLLSIWLVIFSSVDKWKRIAALLICTPLPFLMTLAGSPWAAATPLALLLFLVCVARRSSPEGSHDETPSARAGIPDVSREIPRFAESHPLV